MARLERLGTEKLWQHGRLSSFNRPMNCPKRCVKNARFRIIFPFAPLITNGAQISLNTIAFVLVKNKLLVRITVRIEKVLVNCARLKLLLARLIRRASQRLDARQE